MIQAARTVPALLLLAAPGLLSGQNVLVDEGSFRLSVNGEVVGREEFSIRRVGMGEEARLILRGAIEMDLPGGRRALTPALEATGGEMTVTAYQLKVTGATTSEIYVSRSGRRFLAKIISSQGEEVREFRAGPGSILMDRDVAHQHHLLLPFLNGGPDVSLTLLEPEAGQQVRMILSFLGDEEVRVGTELIQGRHYRLAGGEATRDIWFDGQGRILRVAVPQRGYLAERESLG
ncbi:MAG: hypothetical protein ACWGSQ_02215 [Longimicrobiales bacterium]